MKTVLAYIEHFDCHCHCATNQNTATLA